MSLNQGKFSVNTR